MILASAFTTLHEEASVAKSPLSLQQAQLKPKHCMTIHFMSSEQNSGTSHQITSVKSFKSALTKWMMTLQDHPPVPGIASHNSLTEVISSVDVVQGSVEEEDGWGEDALMISS